MARKLAHSGTVELPKVQNLGRPVLEAFCAAPCDLYLPGIVKLDPEDAAGLETHRGVLDLENLVDPPPTVLACILCNDGPLGLGSVRTLGKAPPKMLRRALERHKGLLGLDGLQDLTAETAEAFARRDGITDLRGIAQLPLDVAEKLRNCRGTLNLGVKQLDPPVIEELLRHRHIGPGLVFPMHLRANLAEDDARRFEKHEGLHFGDASAP